MENQYFPPFLAISNPSWRCIIKGWKKKEGKKISFSFLLHNVIPAQCQVYKFETLYWRQWKKGLRTSIFTSGWNQNIYYMFKGVLQVCPYSYLDIFRFILIRWINDSLEESVLKVLPCPPILPPFAITLILKNTI